MKIELLESRVLPSTFISVTSGNWNDPLTWAVSGLFDADGIPDANDAVFIGTATPQIVTIPTGFAAQADSVTIGAISVLGPSRLDLASSSSSLTVGTDLSVSSPLVDLILGGSTNSLRVDAGSATVHGDVFLNGTVLSDSAVAKIRITTG